MYSIFGFLKSYLRALAVSYVFLLPFPTHATASDDTIFWGEMHLPPISYLKGPKKGTGLLNLQLDQILAALPNYKQTRIPVSTRRLLKEIQSGRKFCFQALTKSKLRALFIDFAAATLLVLPNGLIASTKIKHKLQPFINDAGQINLRDLLKGGGLTMVDFQDRSYSDGIDDVLQPYRSANSSILDVRSGMPNWELASKQVLHNRFDLMIGRPGEVYITTGDKKLPYQLMYLPIEGEGDYSLLYAGCSKGEWNKTYLQDLRAAIIKIRSAPEFTKLVMDRIPAALHPIYEKHKNAMSESDLQGN